MFKYFLITIFSLITISVSAKPCADIPYRASFIAGEYTVIGREPDSEKTFTGKMRIEALSDQSIRMVETLGSKAPRIWQGQFRAASPGEGCVLEVDSKQASMACLVAVDLDNNARLSCLWKLKNGIHKLPGLIALFAARDYRK